MKCENCLNYGQTVEITMKKFNGIGLNSLIALVPGRE